MEKEDINDSSDHPSETELLDSQVSKEKSIKRWVPEGDEKHCTPYYDFLVSLFIRFDISFVVLLIAFNVAFGAWILIELSFMDLFRTYMDQDPGDVAVYKGIIYIPWSLKIIYGIITDNVPIFGLKRKPYLIIAGTTQFLSLSSLYFFEAQLTDNPMTVVLILMIGSLSQAFSNVVIDAIIVIQARLDPRLGSQDLLSVAWLFQSFGGVIGCLIAALMLDNIHPKYAFLGFGVLGLFLAIGSCFLSSEAEFEVINDNDMWASDYSSEILDGQSPSEAAGARAEIEGARIPPSQRGCWFNFIKNMKIILWALTLSEIYRLIIYFILDGLTNPSFTDFQYFFYMNVLGLSNKIFALIQLVSFIFAIFGVAFYEAFLKGVEVRTILIFYVIANSVTMFLSYVLAMRWNQDMNIPDLVWIFVNDGVQGALQTALQTLPVLSLFAKICPARIEGSLFALLTGVMNLDQSVLQPMVGAFVNYEFVGVTKDDLSGYPTLMLIATFCALIGFALIPIIPTSKVIRQNKRQRIKQQKLDNAEKDARRQQRLEERQINKDKRGQ